MTARELFEAARRAHGRIPELSILIEEGGFDWRPDCGGTGGGNPTEAMAIASIELVSAYSDELASLEGIVGDCLRIVEGVRTALGQLYADVLDLFYIDALPWTDVADECRVSRSTAARFRDVALDWVDGVGTAHASAGYGTAT